MTAPFDGPACVLPGCRRPAAPGWQVCRSDGEYVASIITRLGDRHAALSPAKSMAAPSGNGTHGGGLTSQRDPARMQVLALTDRRGGDPEDIADELGRDDTPSVFAVLTRWACHVRDTRDLTYPSRELIVRLRPERAPGPLCPVAARMAAPCRHPSCRAGLLLHTVWADLTVATERAVLAAQLDWILGQEWAAGFHSDITSLWTQLGGGPRPTGHVCPDCGGGLGTYRGGAVCAGCGRRWEGLALIELNTGRTA